VRACCCSCCGASRACTPLHAHRLKKTPTPMATPRQPTRHAPRRRTGPLRMCRCSSSSCSTARLCSSTPTCATSTTRVSAASVCVRVCAQLACTLCVCVCVCVACTLRPHHTHHSCTHIDDRAARLSPHTPHTTRHTPHATHHPNHARARHTGFCKQQLWPLFHYVLPMSPASSGRFNSELWQAYVKANKVRVCVCVCAPCAGARAWRRVLVPFAVTVPACGPEGRHACVGLGVALRAHAFVTARAPRARALHAHPHARRRS
jgi:hypothetical protein